MLFRSPPARFTIEYNPNNGEISYGSQGFLPIEEIGVLNWLIHLRMQANLKANDTGLVTVPAGALPPPNGRQQ